MVYGFLPGFVGPPHHPGFLEGGGGVHQYFHFEGGPLHHPDNPGGPGGGGGVRFLHHQSGGSQVGDGDRFHLHSLHHLASSSCLV